MSWLGVGPSARRWPPIYSSSGTTSGRSAAAEAPARASSQWRSTPRTVPRWRSRLGAVLVTTGNLYAYGPVDRPLTEDLQLAATGTKGRVRAGIWSQARAAAEAGRVRVSEARA